MNTASSIWYNKNLEIEDVRHLMEGDTMARHLNMEWVEVAPDQLKLKMPVNAKTKQPYGILHGGASCALAETIGSIASYMIVDPEKFICVGMEINANHIKSVREGFVTATAVPLHLGRSSHVWDIKLRDDNENLICVSRFTVAVIAKQ